MHYACITDIRVIIILYTEDNIYDSVFYHYINSYVSENVWKFQTNAWIFIIQRKTTLQSRGKMNHKQTNPQHDWNKALLGCTVHGQALACCNEIFSHNGATLNERLFKSAQQQCDEWVDKCWQVLCVSSSSERFLKIIYNWRLLIYSNGGLIR